MPSEFGEPWRVEDTPEKCYIHDSDGKYICSPRLPAEALHPYNWREERSARIVACVNFCREFPTEALEGRMLKYLKADSEIVSKSVAELDGFDGFVAVSLTPVVKVSP